MLQKPPKTRFSKFFQNANRVLTPIAAAMADAVRVSGIRAPQAKNILLTH
jgi:hypothetical protein